MPRKPEASLAIQVTESYPRQVMGVVVMQQGRQLAYLSVRELRRCLTQIDHLEVAHENGIIHEEDQ